MRGLKCQVYNMKGAYTTKVSLNAVEIPTRD